MNELSIRVGVVAEGVFVRRSLSRLLEEATGLLPMDDAEPAEAVRMVMGQTPDVVLFDVGEGRSDGLLPIERIRKAAPQLPLVAVLPRPSARTVLELVGGGARAVVLRDAPPEQLVMAIRAAWLGGFAMCSAATGLLVSAVHGHLAKADARTAVRASLTEREGEVIVLLCSGKSNREIARELKIAESTVKSHLARVMTKWEVRDRIQVVIEAVRAGFAQIS